MSEDTEPEQTWRSYVVQAAFALAGALVIAFVFVPLLSPDTDRVTAFVTSLLFMALTIAATYTVKRP